MKRNCKWIAGIGASAAIAVSSLACSDSGDKRAVADSSGSHYRTNDNNMSTASVSPAPTPNHTYESRPYTDSAYDNDSRRRIVRVSADDPAIYGTQATATYDDGSPRTSVYTPSTPSRSTITVQEAPPLLPPEQLSRTPRTGEFWVSSHWRWDGNRYVLEPGRMEKLRANELYHPAKWTQADRGWECTPAYWD